MWRNMAVLGFHMRGLNISGRIKQSFYPRTRHGELKVISMIYAPPYLIRRSVPKVKSIARSHRLRRLPRKRTRRQTLESKQWLHTITTEHHMIKRHHTTRQHGTNLSSRTVTSSLSGASVTHDEYRTFYGSSSCLATGDQTTVVNMAIQAIMA